QDMVAPTPPDQLAELLEDQQVENASRSHFVIIVTRYFIPVQPLQRLRERDDKRDGERIGVSEYAHGGHKVGGPPVEATAFRHDPRDDVRDKRLDDKDDGNDAELDKLIGIQLGTELGED